MRVERRADGKVSIHMSQAGLERLLALVEVADVHENEVDADEITRVAAQGLGDLDHAVRAFRKSPEWAPPECCGSYRHLAWCHNK